MPASPATPGPVRSAAAVNAEIRELASRLALTEQERQQMTRLWSEWRDAVAAEAELAA